jgi:hypothetical protein
LYFKTKHSHTVHITTPTMSSGHIIQQKILGKSRWMKRLEK